MSEWEILIIGFCGGCIASLGILINYHYFIKHATRKYCELSDEIKAYMKTRSLEQDVKQLKQDVLELFQESKKD